MSIAAPAVLSVDRRRVGGLVLGTATAGAIALAVVASRHAHPAEVSPVVPEGGWNTLWTAGVVGALVLYVAGVAVAARAALGLRTALTLAVLVQALPLAGPLVLSKDAYLYWNEGRVITVHHSSPYSVTPSEFPGDPALPLASANWRAQPAPYGPVWEAVGAVPAAAAGSSAGRAQLGYRVLALLGVLAAVGIVAWRTRNAAAVALLGWSPVVALHFAGGGHSDAWMVALLVLAVALRGRAAGGGSWILAAGFKAFPLVLLPLELARTRLKQPRAFWTGLVGAAAALTAVSVAAFGTGWATGSLAGAHETSPLGGVHWLMEAGLRHRYAVAVGALVFLAVYALLLRHAWRSGRARLSLAATALCLCTSLLRPWYALWPLALAAVEEDGPAAAAALALSAYLLLGDAVRL